MRNNCPPDQDYAEYRAHKMREYRKRWKAKNKAATNKSERARAKDRYRTDPEYRETKKRRSREAYNFEYHLRKTYGITYEQYVEMFARQSGRCAACRNVLVASRKSTHVDHDHRTQKVRGLLCRGCNLAEGNLEGDPARMRALADYVERHAAGGDA